jgi:uncharacterized protein
MAIDQLNRDPAWPPVPDRSGLVLDGLVKIGPRQRWIAAMARAVAVMLVLPLASGSAMAASYDCAHASTATERTICRTPALSALDSEMGGLWYAFSRVPMLMGANGARHDEADAFLQKRSACAIDQACLQRVYASRIAELRHEIDAAMQAIAQEENGTPAKTP